MMPGIGGDPRQMAQMMRRFGIDVKEIEDVQEVVVRTASKDYVFSKASVSVMKAQGVETWQVSGKPKVVEKGTGVAPAPTPAPEPAATYEPSGEDVALVAKETGKTAAAARQALVEANGDLAEAILRLQA
jgi:nascent polypeptide-associated complex subunit alpha